MSYELMIARLENQIKYHEKAAKGISNTKFHKVSAENCQELLSIIQPLVPYEKDFKHWLSFRL